MAEADPSAVDAAKKKALLEAEAAMAAAAAGKPDKQRLAEMQYQEWQQNGAPPTQKCARCLCCRHSWSHAEMPGAAPAG